RGDLTSNILRLKISHLVELEIEDQIILLRIQLVFHVENHSGPLLGHDPVHILSVNLNEVTVLQSGQGCLRLTGKVGKNADDEGNSPFLDRTVGIDVEGNMNSRRANPPEPCGRTLLGGHIYSAYSNNRTRARKSDSGAGS